jgi:hypothetical protein
MFDISQLRAEIAPLVADCIHLKSVLRDFTGEWDAAEYHRTIAMRFLPNDEARA